MSTLSLRQSIAHGALIAVGMMAVTWAVLSAGWVPNALAVQWVTLVAVADAVLVTRVTKSRALALLVAPIPLAYLVIIPTTHGSMPDAAGLSFPTMFGRYVNASAFGLAATDDWTFIVALSSILWVFSYFLTYMSIEVRRPALGALPAFGILGINALDAPQPGAVVRPTLIAALALLLVIAAGQFHALSRHWQLRGLPTMPMLGRSFALQSIVAVGGLLCIAALIPPVSSADFSRSIFRNNPLSQIGGSGAGETVAFSPDVNPGGALVSRPQALFTYTSDTVGAYLRVENDGYFQAGIWQPGPPSGISAGVNAGPGTIPRDPAGVGSQASPAHLSLSYLESNVTGDAPLAIFPGDASALSQASEVVGIGGVNGLLTVDKAAIVGGILRGTTAQTVGLRPGATAAQLRTAGMSYPEWVRPFAFWSEASSDAAQITSLARTWTRGAASPYDAAVAIESHLRDARSFTYTLTPPQPQAGEWSITYFLTQSHQGYCQYYASSMGAMLRSLGIPARLVTGFGPGSVQETKGTGAKNSRYTVTTSDAHVWVEAYFPTYGWIPFEPTPPSVLGDYEPFSRGPAVKAAPTPSANPTAAAPTPTPVVKRVTPPHPIPVQHGGGLQIPTVAIRVFGAAAVVVLGAILFWLWMRRARTTGQIWRRLRFLAWLMRIRPKYASETERAYTEFWISRLSEPHVATIAEDLRTLERLSSKQRFSAEGAEGDDERVMVESWQRILRTSPALMPGRWRQP